MAEARRPDEEQNPITPQGLPIFNFYLSPSPPMGTAMQLARKGVEYVGEEKKARQKGYTIDFTTGALLPSQNTEEIKGVKEKLEEARELTKNPPKPKKVERQQIKPAEYGLLALGALLASALKVNPEDIAEFAGAYLGTREKGLEQKYQEEKEAAEQEYKTQMFSWEAQMKQLTSEAGVGLEIAQIDFNTRAQIANTVNTMRMRERELRLAELQGERAMKRDEESMEKPYASSLATSLNPLHDALNGAIKLGDPVQIELAVESLEGNAGTILDIVGQGVFRSPGAQAALTAAAQRARAAAAMGRRAATERAPFAAAKIADETNHTNYPSSFSNLAVLARYFDGGLFGILPYAEAALTKAIFHSIDFVGKDPSGDYKAVIGAIPGIMKSISGSFVSSFGETIAQEINKLWQSSLDSINGGNAVKTQIIAMAISSGRAPTKEELKRAGFSNDVIQVVEGSRPVLESAVKTALDPIRDIFSRAGDFVIARLGAMGGFFAANRERALMEIAVKEATRDFLNARASLVRTQEQLLPTEVRNKTVNNLVQGLHALRNIANMETPNVKDAKTTVKNIESKLRELHAWVKGQEALMGTPRWSDDVAAGIQAAKAAIDYYTDELKRLRDIYDRLSVAQDENSADIRNAIQALIDSLYKEFGGKK